MKHIFLNEAIRIADQLILYSKRDIHGVFWETATIDSKGRNKLEQHESIYSGTSGVVLFFIELYKITKHKRYLEIAEEGMSWVDWYCKTHISNNFGFINGRMGVAYVYLSLYEVTHNDSFLTKALEIGKSSEQFLENYSIYDFIGGISGVILVLLRLHSISKEEWLLDIIDSYVAVLIKETKYGKVGMYWDVNEMQSHPLSGFGHGTGGIGFVFLELGHYFNNPTFFYIADQAFQYENFYFDKKTNNWPDFRVNMWGENIEIFKKSYLEKRFESFTQSQDMNAWCYGAAGIGLSRLRAAEFVDDKYIKQDIQRAIHKTQITDLNIAGQKHRSFSLCHGSGGNAEIFIENYLATGYKKYLIYAQKIGKRALQQKNDKGMYISGFPSQFTEDASLFNGIAGIGYSLLRVAYPKKIPSILAPKITTVYKDICSQKYPSITISPSDLQEKIIMNHFPKTLTIVKKYKEKEIEDYFKRKDAQSKESFITFVKSNLMLAKKQTLPDEEGFTLELLQQELIEKRMVGTDYRYSSAFIFIKDLITSERAEDLMKRSNDEFLEFILEIDPEVILSSIEHSVYIIRLTPLTVESVKISVLCEKILNIFKSPTSIKICLDRIVNYFQTAFPQEGKIIREKTILQIKELLKSGILKEYCSIKKQKEQDKSISTTNVVVIGGSGFWADRNHYPALISLKNTNIKVKIIAICDPRNPYTQTDKINLKKILGYDSPIWIDASKDPTEIFRQLEYVNNNKKIDLVIIATNPLYHYEYAMWAVKKGINVVCDKPLIVNNNVAYDVKKAKDIYKKYTALRRLVIREQKKNNNYIFSLLLSKRSSEPYIYIANELKRVYEQTGEGIRHINMTINNGINKYPLELQKTGAHGYAGGIGSLSHTSYHYIDLLSWYLSIAPGKIKKIRIDISYVFRVRDYLNIEGYKTVQSLIEKNNIYSENRFNEDILASELDCKFTLTLLNSENNKIGSITFINNDSTFTPRLTQYDSTSIEYASDIYGGRMHQMYIDIHQGAIQNFFLIRNEVVFTNGNTKLFHREHPKLRNKDYTEKIYDDTYSKNTIDSSELLINIIKKIAGVPIDKEIIDKLTTIETQDLTNKLFATFYELIASEYSAKKKLKPRIINL